VARYERKDAFHRRAKREGYRSRAAYKLQEMERAQRLIAPGARVVDLGCWPGGWLQVAGEAVGPTGCVVGIDLAALDAPLELANVFSFQGDFGEVPVLEMILERLGGPADVLLSDAAPKLTGVRATDRAREEALLEAIEAALPRLLAPGGALLVKLLDCPESAGFAKRIRACFESARELRPEASRKGSSERYLVAKRYRAM